MKPQLCNFQALVIASPANAVDHPVFLRNPPRPPAGQIPLQWLRLSGAFEGGPLALLDQVVDEIAYFVIRVDPMLVVFPSLVRKNQFHSASSRSSPVPASSWAMEARKRDAF